jgi:outer membrane protein insertion porin family/translocation and assembly module TamA
MPALRRLSLWSLLLASLVLPAIAAAQDTSCRPGDPEVRSLNFSGNRAFSDDELSQIVATTASSWWRRTFRVGGTRRCLVRDELARDQLRIALYYQKRGYWKAQVDTVVTPRGGNAVAVRFDIVEGEPIRLAELGISGLDSVQGRETILRGLDLTSGGPFDEFRLETLRDSLYTRLLDNGYPGAILLRSFDIDTIEQRATYDIEVNPGRLARIEDVVVVVDTTRGEPQKIRSRTVKKILGLRPGSIYRRRDVVRAQRNLYATDAYRHIELGLAPNQTAEDSLLVIQASLIEGDMRTMQTGIGWATIDCFRTQATLTDRNFLSGARRLEVTGRVSKIGLAENASTDWTRKALCTSDAQQDTVFGRQVNYYLGATYRQPTFFGLRARSVPTFTVYSELRSEFKQYERRTPIGIAASVTREQWTRAPLTFAYSVERGKTDASAAYFCGLFKVCAPDIQSRLRQFRRLAVASAALTVDRTDVPLTPSRGAALRFEVRHASKTIGSDKNQQFNKGIADLSWYTPVGDRAVFAARVRGGVVLGADLSFRGAPFSGENFVPPQERLYAGGPNTVRGFQQNELGPTLYVARQAFVDTQTVSPTERRFTLVDDPNAAVNGRTAERRGFDFVPTGGNTLVVGNAEVRIRDPFLPNLLQWTVFADVGKVWERRPGFSEQLSVTPGLGLSFLSFLGPIGVTAGYNRYARPRGRIFYNDVFGADATNGTFCLNGKGIPTVVTYQDGRWMQDESTCTSDFKPESRTRFWDRVVLQFSIGQAF